MRQRRQYLVTKIIKLQVRVDATTEREAREIADDLGESVMDIAGYTVKARLNKRPDGQIIPAGAGANSDYHSNVTIT